MYSSQPETIFSFQNGKQIALWQNHEASDSLPGNITYSGFCLTECGSDSVILVRNEHENCTTEMSEDTLIVMQLSLVAMSPNLDMVYMPWRITKIHYQGNNLLISSLFNKEIHYDSAQISLAKSRINTSLWKEHAETPDSVAAYRMMRFASQMMIAAISGDTAAERYFHLFSQRFAPEGKYKIWMKEMEAILSYARTGNPNPVWQ